MPLVSIIISNRNDVAMLVVTIRSCIEELKPLGPGVGEIVVVDNSDAGVWEHLQGAAPIGYCRDKTLRMYRQDFPCLFSARETAAKRALGKYIICLDSHMIVGRNMIFDLVNFMESSNGTHRLGFAHAPINWAHQHESRSRHDRNMSKHELGPWGKAYKEERKITWKGMPWICNREWFLDYAKGLGGYGALSKHHVSWGGGDMHIGIKPWLLGFENWAVPTSPGIHIGPFPKVDYTDNPVAPKMASDIVARDRYRVYARSGNYPHTFGFLVSCYVLGGVPMMERNKPFLMEKFGKYLPVDEYWNEAIEIGSEERKWLSERQQMTFEELVETKPWEDSQQK